MQEYAKVILFPLKVFARNYVQTSNMLNTEEKQALAVAYNAELLNDADSFDDCQPSLSKLGKHQKGQKP